MAWIRIDQLIRNYFPNLSRSQIQELIDRQKIKVKMQGAWTLVTKPSQKVDQAHILKEHIGIGSDELLDYVSRGALKLKQALDEFGVAVEGKICLDVGLSTGGFSDLLLKRGAKRVLGVDVGSGQLHSDLRNHPRLVWADKVNARDPIPIELLERTFGQNPRVFDLIVIDVSFISLELVVPALIPLASPEGIFIALVKPQFELNRASLNKQGVVRSEELRLQAVQKIIGVFTENGLEQIKTCPSPIEGENGNKEVLLLATRRKPSADSLSANRKA